MATFGREVHTEDDIDTRAKVRWNYVASHVRDNSQQYCVLSIVGESTNQRIEKDCAIRVHGCRATREEADDWAKEIRDSNDFFDVYVMPTNAWAVVPPDVSQIDNVKYQEKRLQDIHDTCVSRKKGESKHIVERLQQEREMAEKKQLEEAEKTNEDDETRVEELKDTGVEETKGQS